MTTTKLLTAAAALVASLAAGSAANGLPVYTGYKAGAGPIVEFANSGQDGFSGGATSSGSFIQIQLNATGSPLLDEPDLFSNTITIKSTGAGTITLYASEIGITTPVFAFASGFTNNNGSTVSVTEATYAGASTKFDMTNLLSTATLAPNSATDASAPFPSLPSPYSVTETYTVSFGATGGRINATITETGVVPEPASMALLGSGLLGLGLVARRRRGAG